MAYGCRYQVDRGVPCVKWLAAGEDYCSEHKSAIEAVESLWQEVIGIIRKALRK